MTLVENVVVGAIVGIVLLLTGRFFYRTLTGKSDGCGCGNAQCGMSGSCALPCDGASERRESVTQCAELPKETRR